jgi:hypothetical protein
VEAALPAASLLPWVVPGLIALVVILGLVLILRSRRRDSPGPGRGT